MIETMNATFRSQYALQTQEQKTCYGGIENSPTLVSKAIEKYCGSAVK